MNPFVVLLLLDPSSDGSFPPGLFPTNDDDPAGPESGVFAGLSFGKAAIPSVPPPPPGFLPMAPGEAEVIAKRLMMKAKRRRGDIFRTFDFAVERCCCLLTLLELQCGQIVPMEKGKRPARHSGPQTNSVTPGLAQAGAAKPGHQDIKIM